ncbi:MAG TPA: hypothetical protein VF705_12960 [Longimicrobium sp.]
MRSAFLALVAGLLMLHPVRAAAQGIVPPVVTQGLTAYKLRGPEAALEAWMAGWPAETIPPAKERMLGTLKEIETVDGPMVGYDYLGTAEWGAHARRIYFTLLGNDRPAYLRLDVYQSDGTWRVLNVTIHTDPAQVFTTEMLSPGAH